MFFLSVFACKKKENVNTSNAFDSSKVFTHEVLLDTNTIISGISDIHIDVYDTAYLNIELNSLIGNEEKVDISIEGLPDNVTARFEPRSGYTNYNTTLIAKAYFLPKGSYPVKIITTREYLYKKYFDVNIVIDGQSKNQNAEIFLRSVSHTDWETRILSPDRIIERPKNGHAYFKFDIFNKNDSLLGDDIILGWNESIDDRYGCAFETTNRITQRIYMVYDCYSGNLIIPEQTALGQSYNTKKFKDFIIKGSGKVDYENDIYIIEYETKYELNGTTRTQKFILSTLFNRL